MKIWARYHPTVTRLASNEPALLLEGSWPGAASPASRWSLDRTIDAHCDWIDRAAAELAESAIATPAQDRRRSEFVWLNVVKLRYVLVKLLRVAAFFRELWPLAAGQRVELFLDNRNDEPYAMLLAGLCATAGCELQVTWLADDVPQTPPALPDDWWRRGLGWANARIERGRCASNDRPRIVLCGNPRILDPVAAELVRRGHRGWWLYERFAVRSWLKWTGRGLGQIVVGNRASSNLQPNERLRDWQINFAGTSFDSVDALLSAPVACWFGQQAAASGGQQARLLATLRDDFRRRRPTHVVLDQDATPLNRAVVLAARDAGARSLVVQHGVPYLRFGFAPLEADAICAWGESSRDQFRQLGIPIEQIHSTGFPPHDELAPRMAQIRSRASNGLAEQYLFLATPVPRDDRPDAVSYHQTGETYAAMVRMALAALCDAGIGRLIIKLHPRDPRSAIIRELAGEFSRLKTQIVGRGDLAELLVGTSCVLSCASSAGVEATLAGVPVIQLMPTGSVDLIPDVAWGLLGTARTREELELLLDRARRQWAEGRTPPSPRVFAGLDSLASSRVVDALFAVQRPRASCSDMATIQSRQ